MKAKDIDAYQIEHAITLPLSVMRFNGTNDLESSGCFATTLPKTYNFLFDENNKTPDIQPGEVGIPLSIKHQLNLQLNDTFRFCAVPGPTPIKSPALYVIPYTVLI